jgi:protein-tyrosine phosphatase
VLGPEPGVALRVPDHPLTLEVLKRAAGPVFGTSANPSGKEEARTAEEVRAYFPDLACVLDGGRGRIGVASSVVRIAESGAIRVLREGAVPREEILEAAPWSILCVCTGNTCRSPMAAALFRHELAQESGVATDALEAAGFRIGSAGLSAPVGAPVSRDALAVLLGRGVQGGPEHRSRRLDAALVEEADLVYVMTRAHKEQLVAFHPEARSRTHLLDPDGRDIEDPYGGSPRDYRECFRVLRAAIRKRVRAVLLPPSAGSSG